MVTMWCYALSAGALVRAIATAFGAQRAPLGIFFRRGYPALEVISLLLLAPVIESLLLMGIIELLLWLRSPRWLQVALSALVSASLHTPVSLAFVVAPGWIIMAIAYLMWRQVSWKIGFMVIASIHALLNLIPAISTISYAVHHT